MGIVAAATDREDFVHLDVPAVAWVCLIGVLALLLAIDLALHRVAHEPTVRRTVLESLTWIVCGLAFGGVVGIVWGRDATSEYLAGYVIEKSLSVDNVFVWSVVFTSFGVPVRYQHRVLFWGIFGALALRAVFIVVGNALITRIWWTLLIFGALLVVSGIRVVRHRPGEGEHSHDRAVRFLGRFVPITEEIDGQHFFTRHAGKLVATPLAAALVVVEATDVVFAVDSVPAILAVSREPFLVFASNAFAILGLRSLYFLLAGARERFHYLGHGLGFVLIYVGVKMGISHWIHVPTGLSLLLIAVVLAGVIVASEIRTRREQSRRQVAPADVVAREQDTAPR
jgi:tellurite resistance protein TerC